MILFLIINNYLDLCLTNTPFISFEYNTGFGIYIDKLQNIIGICIDKLQKLY